LISKNIRRWILLFVIVFAVILIPFILFGEQVDAWFEKFIVTARATTTDGFSIGWNALN